MAAMVDNAKLTFLRIQQFLCDYEYETREVEREVSFISAKFYLDGQGVDIVVSRISDAIVNVRARKHMTGFCSSGVSRDFRSDEPHFIQDFLWLRLNLTYDWRR